MKNGIPQIPVKDLKARLDAKAEGRDDFLLLDVREPYEFQIAQLTGTTAENSSRRTMFPIVWQSSIQRRKSWCTAVPGRAASASPSCSRPTGFVNVSNVAGGILAWSDEIDPTVQKY